jgi:hypothetical protein
MEKEKDEWLEVLLKGFLKKERFQVLSMVKRLIKNNVRFATGESALLSHHRV